ncbi:hypothetical protein [Bosea sp. PAMC 26642]|uniref:hypothetical protein n=1 Tax=Bosea sp. (strain PAMC 26642) TaxID=1792307 RepID=UPI0007701D57|nr:hypothetical protein [Bosea sp. PAMC 26642]AMJ60175.1 hypothetical protein AXW83_07575 [Bosea sp. PAMC 26642]
MASRGDRIAASSWMVWVQSFALTAAVALTLLGGFSLAVDPYGARVGPGDSPRPLVDLNQRFVYPQLLRSRRFDAAIVGTSTMRLIDPQVLSSRAAMRFANVAMDAATPWEQMRMALLFGRSADAPKALVWGIDPLWCEADADHPQKRLTGRRFPDWLYDGNRLNDLQNPIEPRLLENAWRVVLHRLGYPRSRFRDDGFAVFTPPESQYDLARARAHIYGDSGAGREPKPLARPDEVTAAVRETWTFPALHWLETTLASLPPGATKILVLPPRHIAALPQTGSAGWQQFESCKDSIRQIAARTAQATVLDYARASPMTQADENFWDGLHYRLPVATRLERDLSTMLTSGNLLPDESFVVTPSPRQP